MLPRSSQSCCFSSSQFCVNRLRTCGGLLLGFSYVVAGLALFLIGLEQALFPLGESMAKQLTDPAFVGATALCRRWKLLLGGNILGSISLARRSALPQRLQNLHLSPFRSKLLKLPEEHSNHGRYGLQPQLVSRSVSRLASFVL